MEKYIYRGKLDRVVDGDTVDALIDVGFDIWIKKRIRFKGIDAWESRTRDLAEKAKGLEAKARLIELLDKVSAKPGFFRIRSHGLGKYGRLLGEIYIGNTNLNNEMVKKNYGYSYDGGTKEIFSVAV